jgi:LysR family glycine cleavage system transcriptional activator
MRITRSALLQNLRVFTVAAHALSFKAAADALCLTPSAVSHRIKDLETDLGIRLFERRTRAVALTSSGQTLLAEIDPLLGALDQAVGRVSRAAIRSEAAAPWATASANARGGVVGTPPRAKVVDVVAPLNRAPGLARRYG